MKLVKNKDDADQNSPMKGHKETAEQRDDRKRMEETAEQQDDRKRVATATECTINPSYTYEQQVWEYTVRQRHIHIGHVFARMQKVSPIQSKAVVSKIR